MEVAFSFFVLVMKNFSPKHNLSRSHTRITVLERCERKYYLNYYDFDLKKRDPELWRQNSVLKRLKSVEMWIGEKSHFLLSDYLHLFQNFYKERDVNPALRDEQVQKIKDKIKTEMEEEFLLSKSMDFSDYDKFFERKFWLSEHFYGENIDEKLPEAIEKVQENLDRFMQSTRNTKIQGYFEDGYQVYIESPREPFRSMNVDVSLIPGLEDVSVLAVPDFWVIFSDQKFLILDWKSGKEDILQDQISTQLKVYALKKLLKMKKTTLDNVNVEAYEIYLNSMNAYGGKIQQEDIDFIVSKIKSDIETQKSFLQDGDAEKNLPLDPDFFHDALSEKKCETCTFREVCKKFFK